MFNAITIFENLFICLHPFFLSINYDVSLIRLWNLAMSTVATKAKPNKMFNAITIFENLFICLHPFFLSINYDVSLIRLWNLAMRLFEVLIAELL